MKKPRKDKRMEFRFGAALAKVVEKYELRQDYLAEMSGITESRFSNIKNQKQGVGIETALNIIEKLPEKARMDLYVELFEFPEVWVSNTGRCRKPGSQRTQKKNIGEFVEKLRNGQFVVVRKMAPTTPPQR